MEHLLRDLNDPSVSHLGADLRGKLDGLREQQQLKAQLQLAAQTGDMAQVERLQKQLQPEEFHSTKKASAQNYGFRPS